VILAGWIPIIPAVIVLSVMSIITHIVDILIMTGMAVITDERG
jgi:hypothetical protein